LKIYSIKKKSKHTTVKSDTIHSDKTSDTSMNGADLVTTTSETFEGAPAATKQVPSSLSLLIVTSQTFSQEQKQQVINKINASKHTYTTTNSN
jgi:hypothetical protein